MSQDKALSSLVRSMRKSLKTEHQLDVPYTALRAAYLRACGENPHAFKEKPKSHAPTARKRAVAAKKQPQPDARVSKVRGDHRMRLYLVEDEAGCLERLAFDADGQYPLPEDWTFKTGVLVSQHARLPSIRRYGLPEYVQRPAEFYAAFGLNADRVRADIDDAGDDSGDTCELEVHIARSELVNLLLASMHETQGLMDLVAEATGLHYGKNFATETPARQAEWFARYGNFDLGPRDAKAEEVAVELEWVWPDESSDTAAMWLNLNSGRLRAQVGVVVPEDIVQPSVRVRVLLPEDEEGEMYDVRFEGDEECTVWSLTPRALREVRKALRGLSVSH